MRLNLINLSIGALAITAVALLVAIFAQGTPSNHVMASGVTATSGDFVVTVGSLSDRDEELLYITDTSQQRMNVYRFDAGKKQIDLVQQLDLQDLRKAAQEKATPGK